MAERSAAAFNKPRQVIGENAEVPSDIREALMAIGMVTLELDGCAANGLTASSVVNRIGFIV